MIASPGPLRTILDATGARVLAFKTDMKAMLDQASIQKASGPFLDAHGRLFGVLRLTVPTIEPDANYRVRILAAMTNSKLTLPNIQAAVAGYFAAHGITATVTALDLMSNPPVAIANSLQPGQFLIQIVYRFTRIRAFFASRAHLGRETFLLRFNVFSSSSTDPVLNALVNAIKAGGYQPLYSFTVT